MLGMTPGQTTLVLIIGIVAAAWTIVGVAEAIGGWRRVKTIRADEPPAVKGGGDDTAG